MKNFNEIKSKVEEFKLKAVSFMAEHEEVVMGGLCAASLLIGRKLGKKEGYSEGFQAGAKDLYRYIKREYTCKVIDPRTGLKTEADPFDVIRNMREKGNKCSILNEEDYNKLTVALNIKDFPA